MIGPQDIDRFVVTTIELVLEIGNIRREIGIGSIRLDQWSINVVTNIGGTKQGLLAIFPILRQLTLGRRQNAAIDVSLEGKIVDCSANALRAICMQLAFGKEDVVVH